MMPRLVPVALWVCVCVCLGLHSEASAGAADPAIRAQLTARRSAVISAELSARVRHLPLQEGARFAAGDLLVAFDDSLQRAQAERAEAVLNAAQRTFAANQRLLALKSIGQIELDLSEAELAKARAEFSYASAMLSRCEIRAPFAGRMSEQRVREQEFVQPGQQLFEILDDGVPQVDFIVPSRWLSWLKVGQAMSVSIDETGRSYPVLVERVAAKAEPVSQSVKIVAGVVGPAPELMAGMSGTVSATATAATTPAGQP